MDFQYTTYEAAEAAVEAAVDDVAGDNPELGSDDAAYASVVSIAGFSSPEVALQLCRQQLGYVPRELLMLRSDIAPSGEDDLQ